MQAILTHPVPSAHALPAAAAEDNPWDARISGRSQQELADAMTWLAWYAPGIFTAVLDYMETCDD
jgi:hypothetical protein